MMAFRLPSPPTFLQKHWRLVLAGVVLLVLLVLALAGISRAQARARDLQTLADVQSIRNALGLYFYFRNDYPPASGVVSSQILGSGEAVCLDKSDEGLRAVCEEGKILSRFPVGFVYKKPAKGDYLLEFNLERAVANLADVNKNGKIECRATKEGIECK